MCEYVSRKNTLTATERIISRAKIGTEETRLEKNCSSVPGEMAVNSNRVALVGMKKSESGSRTLRKWNSQGLVGDLCG